MGATLCPCAMCVTQSELFCAQALFLPKGVLHVGIFLSAELRLPGWFVITEDEFLQKVSEVRSRRTSSLADQES